jgi:hypothetical protein
VSPFTIAGQNVRDPEVLAMSRTSADDPPIPEGQPTLTEIDVNRFCISLLDWDGVHLDGSERIGKNMRVLLSSDDGDEEWCLTLAACEAFRNRYGERV